ASSSHALSYFLNTTRWKHKTQILISGGYSEVIASLAMVIPSFNLLQVSFASVSSDLSDSEKYHNFFRTCPDITHLTRPILPVLAHYNWTSVAILHTVSVTFNRGVEILRHDLGKAGIKVLADEEFTYLSNLKRELKSILDSKAHIIIALIHEADAVKAFCQAFHLGLYGREYVWFVTSWITENFWTNSINDASINCTSEQIKEAAQNYLIVDFVEIEYNNITAVSGMTPYQFQQRYIDLAEKKQIEKNQYVGFAYDAIWAIGLCLDNVIRELAAENKSLDDFRYSDSFVGRTILKEMRKVKFQGISGFKILNNSDQEPPGVNLFRQLQGNRIVNVGLIDKNDRIDFQATELVPIRWTGGRPPVSGYIIEEVHAGIPFKIRISSPNLNYLILTGCILLYASVIIMGIDDNTSYLNTYCKIIPWLNSIGFSLAAGSLFAKTYRAYKVLTTRFRITSPLKDSHLLAIVLILMAIEAILLTFWTAIDPLKAEKMAAPPISDPNRYKYKIVHTYWVCTCNYGVYWLIATLILNGIVLLFGAFLAYESRKIKLSELNDSKQIALCIYNITILCIIIIPISFVIPNSHGEVYAAIGCLILYCTTMSLFTFFFPKMKGNAKPSSIRFRMNENASSRMASEKYESAMGNSELMLSCRYKEGNGKRQTAV
ncbi:Gamma-aminobutyric acid type B receptor subunit 2, partial [Trichoplax sp. H2]